MSATNMDIRRTNRIQIFRTLLKQEKTSKQELSFELGLSLPTIGQNVRDFIALGLAEIDGELASTGGRKAAAITPLVNARLALGVDLTLNHFTVVSINLCGELLNCRMFNRRFSDSEDYYRFLAACIAQFIEESQIAPSSILGIGISVPGIASGDERTLETSYLFNVRKPTCIDLSPYLPYPSSLFSNGMAGGFAEYWEDDFKGNMVYIGLNSNISGAILNEGAMLRGEHMRSAEFGHMVVVPERDGREGKLCYCGKRGHFAAYCSDLLLAQAGSPIPTGRRIDILLQKMKDGDAASIAIFEEYLYYLSVMVVNLRMVFDCDIVLGGLIGSYLGPYLEQLRAQVGALNNYEDDAGYLRVCHCKVQPSALGAGLLIVDRFIRQM